MPWRKIWVVQLFSVLGGPNFQIGFVKPWANTTVVSVNRNHFVSSLLPYNEWEKLWKQGSGYRFEKGDEWFEGYRRGWLGNNSYCIFLNRSPKGPEMWKWSWFLYHPFPIVFENLSLFSCCSLYLVSIFSVSVWLWRRRWGYGEDFILFYFIFFWQFVINKFMNCNFPQENFVFFRK